MPRVQRVEIYNLSRDSTPPLTARTCDTFACRLRGLTFRRSLAEDEALLLVYARDSRLDTAIHMLGVLVDLAVAWIDGSGEVVDVRLARRWRAMYVPRRPARYVLEMPVGRLNDWNVGDKVRIEKAGMDH